MIIWLRFNSHRGHVIQSLDKAFYGNYLCLVASNKRQIFTGKSQTSTGRLRKQSATKRVRIRPKDSVTVAFSWQEEKDASFNQ